MCAFFDSYNHSFKWIIYLVVVAGVYTFLHWLLAVPLLYFHFYECCNEKWTENWVVWFLLICFGFWVGFSLLILFIWCCLKLFFVKHLNDSNVHLTDKKKAKQPEVMINEKTMAAIREKNSNEQEEIVVLPDFNPKGSFTIIQMNDVQCGSPLNPEESFDIDENQIEETKTPEKPEKTPREIFFQDLLEGASDSYFDFDPEKISEYVKSKYDKPEVNDVNIFVSSKEKNENLTSEIVVTLNEQGVVLDEPAPVGEKD